MSVLRANQQKSDKSQQERSPRHLPEQARQKIKESAVRFLEKRPYRDLTVAELMEGTTLSRPAFYQYFDDLHDLIASLIHEIQTAMHQTAHPWMSGEGEPLTALRKSQIGVIQSCVEHGPILRAIAEAAPLDPQLESQWSAFLTGWDDAVEERIKIQQKEGLISDSLDARRTANALNSMDTSILLAEFGRSPQGDPEAVLEILNHIWKSTLYG